MFEKLNLSKMFLSLFERQVRPAKILSFTRQYLLALLNFPDHNRLPTQTRGFGAKSLLFALDLRIIMRS